jgi:hypothetical protein
MNIAVISGGQTGADQGGLRAAKACGIPTRGFAPRGWQTEDGPAPWLADFGLVELPGSSYAMRTSECVAVSDACLLFGDTSSPGSHLTMSQCLITNIPCFVVKDHHSDKDVAAFILKLPSDNLCLMIAGNRESKMPGIGAIVEEFMIDVFKRLKEQG